MILRVRILRPLHFVLCGLLASSAQSAVITPAGGNDAVAYHDWDAWSDWGSSVQDLAASQLTSAYNPGSLYSKYSRVPVLEFPLASLAGGLPGAVTLNVYFEQVDDAWGVQKISYVGGDDGVVDTRDWMTIGQAVASLPGGFTTGWFSADVTSSVQDALDNHYDYAVFSIRSDGWPTSAVIRASEYAGYSPNLTVVPEPAALAAIVLAGAAGLRRRR